MAMIITATARKVPLCRNLCIWISVRTSYWDSRIQEKLEIGKNLDDSVTRLSHNAVKHRYENYKHANELKNVHNGANILSEFILYGILTVYIVNESNKVKTKERLVAEAVKNDLRAIQDQIDDIKQQLLDHQIQINDYQVPKSIKPVILQLNPDRTIKPSI